ncbi:hypothetical protein MCEKH45_00699 [Methylophilaceae bacterium]
MKTKNYILNFVSFFVIGSILLLSGCGNEPEEIEIKGIRIGMAKDQLDGIIYRIGYYDDVTVGGAKMKNITSDSVEYRDGKLDSIYMLFDLGQYNSVLAAIENKYPGIECKQNSCSISDKKGSELKIFMYTQYTMIKLSSFKNIADSTIDSLKEEDKKMNDI